MSSASLEAAFRATTYRVNVGSRFHDLRIGEFNPAFDVFLRTQGVSCWGVLTACNPQAARLSNAENQRRQALLIAQLEEAGWRFFAACNLQDAGDWPAEASCLVLQVSEEVLRTLAAEFSQLAVVCGDTGSAPRLLWV